MSDALFAYDRDLGCRYVCGADEAGRAAWAGPLVAAAVRLDYEGLGKEEVARLTGLNDSKRVSPRRRAALLPIIMEVADMVAVVVVSAAQIDRDGLDAANARALANALEAVAAHDAVKLVDWFDLRGVEDPPRPVKNGDRTSAAIAAASIVAKETRDQLLRGLDGQYPGYGLAAHKGYGTPAHAAVLAELDLSPVHRRSIDRKADPAHRHDCPK